jgi:predicted dehydrogenase/threonine dehydrogenase-like Zn-dependent dehydrogenase
MKQVIEEMKTGAVRVVATPVPRCGSHQVLVRNAASLISPGTERMLIEMGRKSLVGKAMARPDLVRLAWNKAKREGFLNVFQEAMARLDQPITLGYSSAGTVIAVGDRITGFAAGDRVACAGYGSADHADVIAVPEELCVKLDDGVSFEEASFVMLGGIAMQGFRTAGITFGETVVVVGLGLLGLLSVQIAKAYGCRVIGIDIDKAKVCLAEELGCDRGIHLTAKNDPELTIMNLTGGQGADAVLLTAATKDNSPLQLAERIARKRGRIVLVGVSDISLTRKAFWDKELEFVVSKASGPVESAGHALPQELVRWTEPRNLREFIRLLGNGSIRLGQLITHRVPIEEAVDAYEMILKGKTRYIGVVIQYPGDDVPGQTVAVRAARPADIVAASGDRKRIAYIGAGLFTRNFLMPRTAKLPGVVHAAVASQTSLSSRNAADKFGFASATTDHHTVLTDASIGSVFVTTRHDLHGRFVAECLTAGKSVFVEKPLCITPEGLSAVRGAYSTSSPDQVLMVGFNRRHSPLALQLGDFLKGRTSPVQMLFRVNASYIPADHWTQNPAIGGGRIIGEGCHFIDLMHFLAGSDPVEVYAASTGGPRTRYIPDDNVSITVRYADGSLGTVIYTALGSKAYSRERLEVYCEESVAVLDDFRSLELVKGSARRMVKLRNQDMGYTAELAQFFAQDRATSDALYDSAVLTTLVSFGAVESLRTRQPVSIQRQGGHA